MKKLTPEEILGLAQAGEGYNTEFKVRLPNKLKAIAEEICAFANSSGGILLIGVSDENEIHGLEIDNAKRSAIQNSIGQINPYIHTTLYAVEIENKNVWVIEVDAGDQKPYTLSGAIYVRQGSNTQRLTTVEQMRNFFQQTSRIYFDESPCVDFVFPDHIEQSWFEEFRKSSGVSSITSREQIFDNLKLRLPSGKTKNGAVLFFGKAPEDYIETASIRCVAFEGVSKTEIVDDKHFGGPLIRQYEQSMLWLKSKLAVRYKIEGSGPREEIWEIPETVFKEAILNALSHRDYYDKGAKIMVELYKDRIEISNPGGLTSAISPSEFGTKSHSRNPLIFGLFVRIGMVEQVGSGIGRMKYLMQKATLSPPEFKTEGFFTVVLRKSVVETVEETVEEIVKPSQVIVKAIKENPNITAKELQKLTTLTRRGVEYQLEQLKKNGVIQRIGPNKGGQWVIL